MIPLTFRRLVLHLLLSLVAGLFLGLLNAYQMDNLLAPPMGWVFWLTIMPLGWLQCLVALFGITALVGGSRVPGGLIPVLGALLVSLPVTLEVRVLVTLLGGAETFPEPISELFVKSTAICLVFCAFAWLAVERRPLGRPPCTWTMLGAGGPGAEVDIEAALRDLERHLSRERAHSLLPALPFHPVAPQAETLSRRPDAPRPTAPETPETMVPEPFPSPPSQPTPEPDSPPGPRLTRMPEGLDGAILCLETEDHYLRIHTTEGQGMILGRLRDAEAELGEAAGLKVHRSWWVARDAVVGCDRDGRKMDLILANGLRVPVSRAHQSRVVEAGWGPA
jgi:hypothetical protein